MAGTSSGCTPQYQMPAGVHDHHRPEAALVQAAAVVDAHAIFQPCLRHGLFQSSMHTNPIAIHGGAPVPAGADKNVLFPDMLGYARIRGLWLIGQGLFSLL